MKVLKLEKGNKVLRLLIIIIFVINCTLSFGQEKKTIAGKEYYIHHVKQGETLYSISKKYNVPVDEIKTENAFLKEGLKPDQEIKIPITKDKSKNAVPQDKVIPKGYIGHEVQKGETLYALSKKYGIKVKEIIELNPEVVNGLKPGETLLIRKDVEQEMENVVGEKTEATNEENEIENKDGNKIHEVQAGETLYSLSKMYDVNTDELIELNPDLKNGLKLGQKIIIPIEISEFTEDQLVSEIYSDEDMSFDSSITNLSDSIIRKEVYNVALLLPFYLSMNDTIVARKKAYEKETIYNKSELAVQFYQGALLALDSLKKRGVAVKLYVVDSDNDTLKVKSFVENKMNIDYDLIIGPLYKSNFEIVSEFAKKNAISIVSPVPQSNKVLLGNEYVSKTSPSRHVQVEAIAEYVVPKYKNQNIFVVNTAEDDEEKKLLAAFLRKARSIENTIPDLKDSVRMVTFGKLKKEKMLLHLDSTVENVIILPSIDPVYVYDFLSLLKRISDKYRITVFGLDKWLGFSNLDVGFLHGLKIHVTSPYYVDYDDKKIEDLLDLFHDNYHTEPSKYGFAGYDIMMHYVTLLDDYGVNMQSYLDRVKSDGVAYSFDFFKAGMESGFENKSTFILKYENFKLVRVN